MQVEGKQHPDLTQVWTTSNQIRRLLSNRVVEAMTVDQVPSLTAGKVLGFKLKTLAFDSGGGEATPRLDASGDGDDEFLHDSEQEEGD